MRGLYKGGQSKTAPTHTYTVVPSRYFSPFSFTTPILQQEEQLLSMENENFLSLNFKIHLQFVLFRVHLILFC